MPSLLDMSYSLNFLKGGYIGEYIGADTRDTRIYTIFHTGFIAKV